MIIFYPPAVSPAACTPVVIADMTDSSDQWSPLEITSAVWQNVPASVKALAGREVTYSCKYNYTVQHNGVPLGEALRMSLQAEIKTPPAELIAQVSVNYVASAQSINEMRDALSKFANPQLKIMTAVIVERVGSSTISRPFIAYSVSIQPDTHGTTATLFISAASFDDMLIKSALGFQLVKTKTLRGQLSDLAASLGYSITFDLGVTAGAPVSGRLFQPTVLPKILSEICLQNKLLYIITGKKIRVFPQGNEPAVVTESPYEFSFLGSIGNIAWGVGIENYANVRFRTPIFDAVLFDKIIMYNDNKSTIFEGLKKDAALTTGKSDAFSLFILRYIITRNDSELCCEVTATNNWLLAQIRVDGIFETKIYGNAL
jgi:hypothetical protein